MRRIAEDPKLLRFVVAIFLGVPVAMILSVAFPDRQGSQFVPFVLTAAVCFGVIALIAVAVEIWATRRLSAADRGKGR